ELQPLTEPGVDASEEVVRAAFPSIASLTDASVGDAVVRVWLRMWAESLWPTPSDCPYNLVAPAVDLVTHVNQVVAGAVQLASAATRLLGVAVDEDVLLAAGTLHDASKLVEYEPGDDGAPRLSELGHRLV